MSVRLIGLSGKAGAGKDTVARMLHIQQSWEQVAFADELKRIAREMGWDGTKDERGRLFLQKLGMAGRDYNPKMWVNLAAAKWNKMLATPIRGVVVSDVRFKNEMEAIHSAGGVVWRIMRPPVLRSVLAEGLATHPSETELDDAAFDAVLVNDGTISDLHRKIAQLLIAL